MESASQIADQFVRAESVSMQFPNGFRALADVDLTIDAGEFVSIVGPSGCGKSTLLRLLAGLRKPTSGTLKIQGMPPEDARRLQHRVGFVFQNANLLPWRSVVENLRLPFELEKTELDRQQKSSRINDALELVGLTEADRSKRPHMLSGGMQMRVALARALVTEPDLLLLDEPFGALDDILRRKLNEELSKMWTEKHWTALFVTHNVAEAVFLSQRVLVMSATPGRMMADIKIPFEFPRSPTIREEPEFARLAGLVTRELEQAMLSREEA